jgi:hypothetical protein
MDRAARGGTLEAYSPFVDVYERRPFRRQRLLPWPGRVLQLAGRDESDGGCTRFRSETLGVVAADSFDGQ